MAERPARTPTTQVTRERVIAPPDRFIFGVQDEELITYFSDVFGSELAPALPVLHQLVEGICTSDFTSLRRRLQGDYEYFGAAAEARSDVELSEWQGRQQQQLLQQLQQVHEPPEELDQQETRFLADFTQLMEASQYRMLSKAEWDAAQAEDFLFTLPCDVKWDAMDSQARLLLPRYWAESPGERESVPEEMADRILVFQRGTEVATMQGSYFMLKVNLLISMWLLQPIYSLFVALMSKLGVKRFVPEAPKGLASTVDEDPAAKAAMEEAARAEMHPASTSIERRTFARVFPDGMSVLKKFAKKVKLQEACFRDVVILYRQAVSDKGPAATEVDVIKEADPKFMQRNIQLRQFRGIPMADLEMIMPEKKIFVPPKVFVEMAVTLVGGVVAMIAALGRAGKDDVMDLRAVYTAVSLLGGRAAQVYTSAMTQKLAIEHAMGKMLYERTVGSGEAVLTSLVDSVCRQRVREIMVCYCVLLNSQTPLTAEELDDACERFLATQFGCKIDFCCEEALPAILKWGLVWEEGLNLLIAVPLPEALKKLDEVWDAIHDFKGSAKAVMQKASQAAGEVAEAPSAESSTSGAAAAPPRSSGMAGAALGRALSTPRAPPAKGVKGMFQKFTAAMH
ncbi:hypothetical protein CHLNCDRAFT_136731 [Chlorella variabilis]|uniref:Uncharacterized protein n=1 Tax=Chlorella variabilis TaxID=554065 RepID=E1ZKY5_CHLVA|nr:hypothetical protein CHLNCDRAFT_136731 [Chlorella variabilis]EFN53569.1 hypothetical protein CHLNCDRAFT_136731 [Chlorella variabilis]|eukprot:XP_005845671.1 hypothetical protein CHLNCDRAFT_136731 [Chlorella variabilis]